jgi:hypothetical protein
MIKRTKPDIFTCKNIINFIISFVKCSKIIIKWML